MNEQYNNRSSRPLTSSVTSPQPGRYLSENERLKRRKKRRQQLMIRRGIVGGVALAILILIIVLIVKGCSGGTDALAGKWDVDGVTFYEFNGKGKGALILPNSTYDFTYEIEENQLIIDYKDDSVHDGSYTFEVNDDKLILIGGEGTVGGTYELTKVNNP